MRTASFVLFALLASGIALADVGPAPAKPEITVTFHKGGTPYTGEISAMYRCWDDIAAEDGPMGQTDVGLSCSGGMCTNDEWSYEFNPCYYPTSGEIIFQLDGGEPLKAEGELAFPEGERYSVLVDVDKGQASVSSEEEPEPGSPPSACPLGAALVLALGAGVLRYGG